MSSRNIAGLIGIATISWLLIIGETYIFFAVVRPLGPPLHSSEIISASLKVGLTAALGLVWIAVMFAMWWLYFRAHRIPTRAS